MIITFGRQHGSNGHDIARALAAELGYTCYDKEIVDHAAENSSFSREIFGTYDEKRVNSYIVPSPHYIGMHEGFRLNMQVASAQFDAIRSLADRGNGIFVGRCADYILRGRDDVVRVFIMADKEFRLKTLMERKGISEDAARKLLFTGGYQIYACINPDIQAIVDNYYQNVSNIPRTYNTNQQLQSAIVVMDPYTGEIAALCGGVGEKTQNFPLNRATGTFRSPGSSFKPIASYGPAVELGYITPNTLVNDSPNIRLNGTSWYPANDGGGNLGVVTIYKALQHSLNTVAAQIVDKIGPQVSYNFLTEKLGVTSLVPDDASYAPMALGQLTNGITVREMAQAYGAFVNDGTFTKSRSYSLVTDNEGNVVIDNSPQTNYAFSANTAHVMTYMMQNAVETGTGREAQLRNMPVAGKTGTSGQYKARWFVGCTPYYVAAVWTGYDQPERIYVSNGGNPAAQIFRSIMTPIHDGLPWKNFPWPMIGGDTGIFNVQPEEEEVEEEDEIILGGEDISGNGTDGNNSGGNIYDNDGNINFGGGNSGDNSGSNNSGGDNSGGNDYSGNLPPYNNGDDSEGDTVVFG